MSKSFAWSFSCVIALGGCQLVASVDRSLLVPDGAGGQGGGCSVDADCLAEDECGVPACNDGRCELEPAPAATPCAAGVCDGEGACVECVDDEQCQGLVCDGATHTCVAAACENGVVDEGETDVDCGGAACPTCPDGAACATGSDCASGSCAEGVCAPCSSSADCPAGSFCDGTGVCADKRRQGTPCGASDECDSGHCADGFCCDSQCIAQCQACNVAGLEGVCTPFLQGLDPDDECAGGDACSGASSCGCNDKLLDGTETDVDCGGTDCPGCPSGKACMASGDCLSDLCTQNVCE